MAEVVNQTSRELTPGAKKWLLIMLITVSAPQLMYVPLWLAVTGGCLLSWVWLTLERHRYVIPRWGKGVVVIAVILGVLVFSSQSKGLDGLSSLLIAGALLKSMELKKQRDGWVLVLVACFIAAVGFLFNQSMPSAVYGGVSLLTIVCALLMMHQGSTQAWLFLPVKKSLFMLLQSIPLMLILFLIFPRIGPLWSVQYQQSTAKTGLSDRMQPGDISRLTRSASVAFRVSFTDNKPPAPEQRYWRVMTFADFDGQGWSIADVTKQDMQGDVSDDDLIEYQVIAEPSASTWLFALDYPLASSASAVQRYSDGTFKARAAVSQRISYTASSLLIKPYDGHPLVNRPRYLAVPAAGNPQTRKMVRQWQQKGFSAEEKIAALFKNFNQHFTYTLSPQKLQGNRIDQFLFDTREGFCEHFANATAYTLRLAGIPSRVVGGYLGGEWNDYEEYLLIRQYEAHAWVEAWLDGKGWIRLDPTTAVAPERVIQPFDQLFSSSPEFMADSSMMAFRLQQNLAWLKTLSLRYDALNYNWHRWILGYHQQQNNLLQDWFGQISLLKMLLLLFIPVGCMLMIVFWWLLKVQSRWMHPVDKEVVAISDLLAKVSVELKRASGETVQMYSVRLAETLPEIRAELDAWSGLYQRLRYADASAQAEDTSLQYHRLSQQLMSKIKRLGKQGVIGKGVKQPDVEKQIETRVW
ncbi:transglutaminase TgpA family protein [Neptunomonas qingdaonensis]|uniref:Transglutaminase-like superfamily protein n=1 Tax=Neptunomonas qingdaonensis TaxID=1045558 RepID=A0A1I2STG8_9GAMM|nr:DUF3488 and DUF4129 domain-containing transglutaminase family protein [Neptunomonas qingdaonensis]SFG54197.1 Transglutaminase-like superfamily protein [Neptunomonas qingdaonensis]